MKTWRECGGSVLARREAVMAALEDTGRNITHAARVLGITPRYLHMVLPSVLGEKAMKDLHAFHGVKSRAGDEVSAQGVNGSPENPLTYRQRPPTLRVVGIVEAPARIDEDVTELKAPGFPRDLKNWLEQIALQRKQRLGERHPSITRTLAEIVREAKERAERGGDDE